MSESKSAATPVPAGAEQPAAAPAVEKAPVVAAEKSKATVAKERAGKAAAGKPAPVKVAQPRKSRLEETKAKNKKALAEALAMAQAVQIPEPPKAAAAASAKPAKPAKAVKVKKAKLVRHAFSMPEGEYAQLATLKKRMAALGGNVKRSELVRAGIALLAGLSDIELTAAMAKVERIKTGRPAK